MQSTNSLLLAFTIWVVSTVSVLAACSGDRINLRGDWGQASFSVELALTPEERAQGLMHREALPKNASMLFIYERSGTLSFWMRNTRIPLDMLFIEPSGRVAHVHQNAIPFDETPISGGSGNLAVLEINGGLSELYGIDTGSVIQHPSMPQDLAQWPCEKE